jgi:hypothetical protein
MARIVTNSLLFLFLVLGCAALNKREVQLPKAPEPMPAPISLTPVQTANDRTITSTTAANPSKEKPGCCKLDLRRQVFMLDPSMG